MRTQSHRWSLKASFCLLALGCDDVSWPSDRAVTSLRILGVEAEPPSLKPGGTSRLSLLCADGIGGGASDPACDIEVAWFAACNNPPSNDPLKCLNSFDEAASQLASPLANTPASGSFAVAPTFEFTSPTNILQGAVDVSGQPVHYGVSYVYFAACVGNLYPVNGVSERLPVECRDRNTQALLDQRRFVVGYTTIYSYDAINNKNPILFNTRFDGKVIPTNSCAADEDCGAGFGCTSAGTCAPVPSHCDRNNPQTCYGHCIDFQVPPASFALTMSDGTPVSSPLKSLWAEYYANAGHLPDDARLGLAPPTDMSTPITSGCAPWQAPLLSTDEARVWVIVRDDRGGLSWIEQRILVL